MTENDRIKVKVYMGDFVWKKSIISAFDLFADVVIASKLVWSVCVHFVNVAVRVPCPI